MTSPRSACRDRRPISSTSARRAICWARRRPPGRANCFSEDPLYHGYFEPNGTTWGPRLGDVRIDEWPDPNHRGDLTDPINAGNAWLTLLFQGFGTDEGGTHTLDDIADQTRDGFPYATDLRGLELEYIMRARDWRMKRTDKLLQLFQTRVPYHGPFSTEIIGGEPTARHAYVNAVQIADPISDQLMLGQGGFGEPNAVDGVHDTGWRKVRIRLSPLASYWKMLGAMTGRSGLPGEMLKAHNYVVETPDNFLHNPAGLPYCLFMVGFHPVLDAASRDTLHDNRRSTGKVQIREVALVRPG